MWIGEGANRFWLCCGGDLDGRTGGYASEPPREAGAVGGGDGGENERGEVGEDVEFDDEESQDIWSEDIGAIAPGGNCNCAGRC